MKASYDKDGYYPGGQASEVFPLTLTYVKVSFHKTPYDESRKNNNNKIWRVKVMRKAVFTLEPLSCPTCIKKIESTLKHTKGVSNAKVMFHSNRVRTQFDENVVEADQLKETIEKLGYPVLSQRVS